MNPNIEIINDNLWVVNFDYVINGWIEGMRFEHTTSENPITMVGNIILLNSNRPIYKKIIPILEYIMNLSDSKIGQVKSFYNWVRIQCPSLKNNTDEEIIKFFYNNNLVNNIKLYMQLTNYEIERRKKGRR